MATVIPFPAERLGDSADALFLALMQVDGRRVVFGVVIQWPGRNGGRLRETVRPMLEAVKEAVLF
jgi:hypothetical protein